MNHAALPLSRSSAQGAAPSRADAAKAFCLSPGARSGVASFLLHVVVLLTLAMVYGYECPPPLKPIALSFDDTGESLTLDPIAADIAMDLPLHGGEQHQQEQDELLAAIEDIQKEVPVEVSLAGLEEPSEAEVIQSSFSSVTPTQLNAVLIADGQDRSALFDNAMAVSSPRPLAMVAINGGNAPAGPLSRGRNSSGTISSSDFGDRLQAAGAKTGDVQISLAWNTIDDIDLHVSYTPGNGLVDQINFMNRVGRLSQGMLDIDMNANGAAISQTPVENVFWPQGSSPRGFFVVSIHFFRSWTGLAKVPVVVRIKNGEDIRVFPIVAHQYGGMQNVYSFQFRTKQDKPSF